MQTRGYLFPFGIPRSGTTNMTTRKASLKGIEAARKLQGSNKRGDKPLLFLTPPGLSLAEFENIIGLAFDNFAADIINDYEWKR